MWPNTCQRTCCLFDCVLCSSLTSVSNSLDLLVGVANTRHRHMARASVLTET